ncbi:MAG: S1 family peptidase [Polyangiaceae bacterium]
MASPTPPPLRDRVKRAKTSTLGIWLALRLANGQETLLPSGSGVAVSATSVLTCKHVVIPDRMPPGATITAIQVVRDTEPLASGRAPSTVAWIRTTDSVRDLALLDAPGLNASPIPMPAAEDMVQDGDDVFFIGHPAWNGENAPPSAVGTAIVAAHERVNGRSMLRLDGNVNRGTSGGALLSRSTGALVGIVDAKAGSLSTALRQVRDTAPSASLSIGGTDPVAVLRETLAEMEANLQLGIGFAVDGQEIDAFLAGDAGAP